MDTTKGRKVRGAIFYKVPERIIGTTVDVYRKDADGGEPEHIQRHELIAIKDYLRKSDGKKTALLHWRTNCTECDGVMEYSARNMTKDLKRRCKPCKEETPYDPEGWSTRPRNIYWRELPEEGEAWVSPTHGERRETLPPRPLAKQQQAERWPLYEAHPDKWQLASDMHDKVGRDQGHAIEEIRDMVEAELRAAEALF